MIAHPYSTMEDNPIVAGAIRGNEAGNFSRNEGNSNDSSLQLMNHVNIAMMSDFQFSESLDALLDNFSETTTSPPRLPLEATPPPLPLEAISCSEDAIGGDTKKVMESGEEFVFGGSFKAQATTSSHEVPASNSLQSSCLKPGLLSTQSLGGEPPVAMMPPPALPQVPFAAPRKGAVARPPMFSSAVMMPHAIGAFGLPVGVGQHTFQPGMPTFPMGAMHVSNNFSLAVAAAQAPGRKQGFTRNPSSSASIDSSTTKRGRDSFAISEDESDLRKRRADRNAREQQRAQQVTDQIAHLRALLEQSGISLSKADKFSTLISVEQYIRQLQSNAAQLAAEHQKLLTTLQQTTERINSQYVPPTVSSSSGSGSETCTMSSTGQEEEEDDSVKFTNGINYKWIFDSCPFAVGLAAIDGRFIDCNKQFEKLTGYARTELLPMEEEHSNADNLTLEQSSDSVSQDQAAASETTKLSKKKQNMSIFNVLHREYIERMFSPMSRILQYNADDDNIETKKDDNDSSFKNDTFAQDVQLCKRSNVKVRVVSAPEPYSWLQYHFFIANDQSSLLYH